MGRARDHNAHNASTYTNHGCRCPECRTSHAAAQRVLRSARVARLAADPTCVTHGRVSTYSNWGCRCDECKAAWAHKRRTQRVARRARAIELAGLIETAPEPENT